MNRGDKGQAARDFDPKSGAGPELNVKVDKENWLAAMRAANRNTTMEAFEIEIVDADSDQIVLEMPITDKTRQPFGLLHGGLHMVLAETAASCHACWGIDLSKVIPVGIEISGSHLRSATDGHIRAIGKVVRRARTLIVHQVDIWHIESEKHLCTSRVTNYYKAL